MVSSRFMVWIGDIVVVPNECYHLLPKTSFQRDDPGPRERGRKEGESMHKRNYTDLGNNLKARIQGRGYHGTTTTPKNSHAARFAMQACPHTRAVILPTMSGICHQGVRCLQGCRELPEFLGCQSSVHTCAMRKKHHLYTPAHRS